MSRHWSAHLLAVLLSLPVFCSAQSYLPTDEEVASLLMGWRWESDNGSSTIDISSSRLMLFEGELYDFALSGGAIKFEESGSSIPYSYDAVRSRLTLDFPDGPPVEYRRTIQSVLARRGTRRLPEKAEFLHGRFSTGERRFEDSAPERRTINFHPDMEFDFGPRGHTPASGASDEDVSPAALGTALVYEDVVIFSFYDSTAAEADVRKRDARGEVESFIYADEVYAREQSEAVILPSPILVPDPTPGPPPPHPIPPYPGPYYPPPPPPYDPPIIVVTPPSSPPPSGREKEGDRRTIGRTRGESIERSGTSGRSGSTGSSGGSSGSSGNRGSSGRGGNRR